MVAKNENDFTGTLGGSNGQQVSVPDWNDYWMRIASEVRSRSPDPAKKVGAVITKDNVLVSTGYNGFPRGVTHFEDRLLKDESIGEIEKLRWMAHAEQNAIFNAARLGVAIEGATIYTTKFPCLLCTKAIVQTGIREIHTRDDKPYDDGLTKDDGRRVFQILMETNVRLVAPNLVVRAVVPDDQPNTPDEFERSLRQILTAEQCRRLAELLAEG